MDISGIKQRLKKIISLTKLLKEQNNPEEEMELKSIEDRRLAGESTNEFENDFFESAIGTEFGIEGDIYRHQKFIYEQIAQRNDRGELLQIVKTDDFESLFNSLSPEEKNLLYLVIKDEWFTIKSLALENDLTDEETSRIIQAATDIHSEMVDLASTITTA